MKIIGLILFCGVCTTILHADAEKISHVVSLAARLDRVEGRAVGDAAEPGYFHLLAKFVIRRCEEGDIEMLLRNESPVVRLLGYQCALAMHDKVDGTIENALMTEKKEVLYVPYGCGAAMISIGQIAREIKMNPTLLLDGPKE